MVVIAHSGPNHSELSLEDTVLLGVSFCVFLWASLSNEHSSAKDVANSMKYTLVELH